MGETLYKYCDQNGPLILETLGIKVTQPNDFNDPFEVLPTFRDDITPDDVVRQWNDRSFIEKQLERTKRYPASEGVEAFFRVMGDKNTPDDTRKSVAEKFAPLIAKMARAEVASTQESWSHYIGILCLSRVPDSVLMWSHYTDKHRGIVIAFDSDKLVPKKALVEVKYDPKRHEVRTSHYFEEASDEVSADYYRNKSPDWRYENEVRVACMLARLKAIEIADGCKIYVLPFPSDAVVGVKLGARCSEAVSGRVTTALKKSKIDCVIEKAVLNSDQYKIEFQAL